MTARTWLYNRLMTHPGLNNLVGQRIFAKKSMSSSVEQHPYIVFKLGYNANESLSEDHDVSRQFIQIFVHDFADETAGDYTQIDEVIRELKLALTNQSSPDDGILQVTYLETSQDLDDDTLSTVMKYVRFQLILLGGP